MFKKWLIVLGFLHPLGSEVERSEIAHYLFVEYGIPQQEAHLMVYRASSMETLLNYCNF